MSSNPPVTPPGGAPPPFSPYDSKAQYRAYREQQKAAWRAQKQAWKAGAGYPGPYIPRVPSMVGPVILIVAGVIGLMVSTGHIAAARLLGVVWEVVAAAFDRRRPCLAGRVGDRSAQGDSGAPQRRLYRSFDSAGDRGSWRDRVESYASLGQPMEQRERLGMES